jgi:hypothetical protein
MDYAPTEPLRILTYPIDEAVLARMNGRRRNQLIGCMHAHNELTFLNRLLLFTQNATADGELHDHAQSIQMWSVLQILAGKLFETWSMLLKRGLRANPPDPILAALEPKHAESIEWLRGYFGVANLKDNAIKLIRDKTAFHYDGLDISQAMRNLADRENTVHLAEHPANTLYYLGSAVSFRAIFTTIADQATPPQGRNFDERLSEGFRIAVEDVKETNWHLHLLLYGLIKAMLGEAAGGELGAPPETAILENAPNPEKVGLPPWVDMRQIGS